MGELFLCNESIAAMPYYMDGLGINIYSLEELSYYISQNVYLLDQDFMNENLCDWIDIELKREKLAEALREKMQSTCRLSSFVYLILSECGYCTKNEIQQIIEMLQTVETKSPYERSKFRADRLLEKNKFIAAIYEYRLLLESEAALSENAIVVGNVWHNLGTAYARLFLFKEASNCYLNAYKKNLNMKSLNECLSSLFCIGDEDQAMKVAIAYHVEEEQLSELKQKITKASQGDTAIQFENRLQDMAELSVTGEKQKYQEEIQKLIYQWKEEYRRISRI